MNNEKPATQKFEVTRKHCLDHSIGDIVELTEKQAKGLVNKIKPVKPAKKASDKKGA